MRTDTGFPIALTVGLGLWALAMAAVLLAGHPAPLRRSRIKIYPTAVVCGSIAGLALVAVSAIAGDTRSAAAAAFACGLFALAAARRASASSSRYNAALRRSVSARRDDRRGRRR